MPLQIIQEPAVEPLSLLEAKLHLRVDVPDDDALILALITSVRQYAETITRRAFIQQTWAYVIDSFPGPTLTGVPWGKTFTLPQHAIEIEKSRVQQVTAINYLDMSGNPQVMPAANYIVDYGSEPCRITPVFGQIWPIPMPQIGACNIQFVAGYAAPVTFSGSTMAVQGAWRSYAVNDAVQFSNVGGLLPASLSPNTSYFIQSVVSPGVYTLSASPGGPAIVLTDAGSGTSLIGVVPEGIKSWMKIRMTSLYEYRGDMVIPERGKVEPLAYVDRLLDPYKVMF
ncbi:MAG: head-tail connector protein [Betaproteobacteria bacterium]|nr:head-tail connector protein [Betaproteobacteria bacterium]